MYVSFAYIHTYTHAHTHTRTHTCLHVVAHAVLQAKQLIREEAHNWVKYDLAMDTEKSHTLDVEASNTLVTLGSKRKSRPPAQFSELGPFVTAATVGRPRPKRPAKRRLDFVPVSNKKGKKSKSKKTNGPTPKGPTDSAGPRDPAGPTDPAVPTVTVASATKSRAVASKDVQKILWAQSKLVNKESLEKQILRKPAKIASLMFDVLPKADVVAMATQLAKHCAVDCLEEVLEQYRHATLSILERRLSENLEHIKALDALVKDAAPKDAAPKDDGPTEKEDGPTEKEAEPILLKTPNPSHWIRSNNTSSGFKGVNKCRGRKGKVWRAKCAGTTIGRFATKAEACQAYYDYCKAHGKLKTKKKKVRDVLEWAS